MPCDAEHLATGAFEQGVIDHHGDRGSLRQQPIHDQGEQGEADRVGAPAGGGEEPVRPRVMRESFQPRTSSMPHTVRRRVCAIDPTTSAWNVMKVGAASGRGEPDLGPSPRAR
jgi:hypothetical protein